MREEDRRAPKVGVKRIPGEPAVRVLQDEIDQANIAEVEEGSYVVTITFKDCAPRGGVSGTAVFADDRIDRSGATVVFQYAPDCYEAEQLNAIAVFDGQETQLPDVALQRGPSARLETTTDPGGFFAFSEIPARPYSGSNPQQPDPHGAIFEQTVGTYALAVVELTPVGQVGDARDGLGELQL